MEQFDAVEETPAPVETPEPKKPQSLDEAMESAFAVEDSDPPAETKPEDEDREADAVEEKTPPADSKEPVQTPASHALTPEEDQLLRRNQASAEDLDFYRSLTTEQRNKALRPLRAAQSKTDKFWSQPPAERAKLSQHTDSTDSGVPEEDAVIAAIKAELMPDESVLKAAAEKEGISLESLRSLESERSAKTARILAGERRDRIAAENRSVAAETTKALEAAHGVLSAKFSQVKDKAVFQDLCNDPIAIAAGQAELGRSGNRALAIQVGLEAAAKVRFYDDVKTQHQRDLQTRKADALKSSPERTSKTSRSAPATRKPPKDLDEAMERAFEAD